MAVLRVGRRPGEVDDIADAPGGARPGVVITAVGAVLPPTEIVTLWSSVAPAPSVTRSVAVTVPAEV